MVAALSPRPGCPPQIRAAFHRWIDVALLARRRHRLVASVLRRVKHAHTRAAFQRWVAFTHQSQVQSWPTTQPSREIYVSNDAFVLIFHRGKSRSSIRAICLYHIHKQKYFEQTAGVSTLDFLRPDSSLPICTSPCGLFAPSLRRPSTAATSHAPTPFARDSSLAGATARALIRFALPLAGGCSTRARCETLRKQSPLCVMRISSDGWPASFGGGTRV